MIAYHDHIIELGKASAQSMSNLKRPVGKSGTMMGHSVHCLNRKQDSGEIGGNDKSKASHSRATSDKDRQGKVCKIFGRKLLSHIIGLFCSVSFLKLKFQQPNS